MNNWFFLIILSAVLLGLYDFSKKCGVNGNRVMPVLFYATLCGALFLIVINLCLGTLVENLGCTPWEWCLLAIKSILVASCWIASYYALHDLPLTIASPIRASAPVWVVIGGILLFHNRPSFGQILGMIITFAGYYIFTSVGRKEGVFWKSRGILMVIAATLLGAASGLFDNYLLQIAKIPANTVQLLFSINLVWVLGIFWLAQPKIPFMRENSPFSFRWYIPAISLLLLLSDWSYLHALSLPNVQIGILSILRRLSVVVSFFCAAVVFGEKNIRDKLLALFFVLAGIIIIKLF